MNQPTPEGAEYFDTLTKKWVRREPGDEAHYQIWVGDAWMGGTTPDPKDLVSINQPEQTNES